MANTSNQGHGHQGGTSSGSGTSTKDKVKDTASSVASQATEMASKVASQAGDMASRAAGRAGDAADSATSSVGSGLQSAAGALRENLPNRGMMGSATDAVANTLESSGRYLEEKGLSGMTDDLGDMIRRYPIPAVLLGIGLGYLIACSTRS